MQLSLFQNLWHNTANSLLDSLNEGRKAKVVYLAGEALDYEGLIIIKAVSKTNQVFNILTPEGKIPNGFSANWRIANHIEEELI